MPKNELPKQSDELVVVFGTQRIGAIYAHRKGIRTNRIVLATMGANALRGFGREVAITVLRVSEEAWQPPTHACVSRTQETEQALKALEREGVKLKTVWLD